MKIAARIRVTFSLLAVALIGSLGIAVARSQATGTVPLSAQLNRRIETAIRNGGNLTPESTVSIVGRQPSILTGYDQLTVTAVNRKGVSQKMTVLLSNDGNKLAQLTKIDLRRDATSLIDFKGRPGRGGAVSAPVNVVIFDDLECPYCAQMNSELFPAITQRYGALVRVIYEDYPLPQHRWALRAAVDVNCVAPQSTPAYWRIVDAIHSQAGAINSTKGGAEAIFSVLDNMVIDEATRSGLNIDLVRSCLTKQDETTVHTSVKLGQRLGVDSTPVMFVNGERIQGTYPLSDIFSRIDAAIIAEGLSSPVPYHP